MFPLKTKDKQHSSFCSVRSPELRLSSVAILGEKKWS